MENKYIDFFNFSKAYSIKEIILILSDINVKITALNDCSTEDFLILNNHLKYYYKQADQISKNASEIFNIIAGKDHDGLLSELKSLQESLKTYILALEKQNLENIRTLDKILTNINLMQVPLKNFNQNIMTIKFLAANLKLSIKYFEKEEYDIIDEEVAQISNLIYELKRLFPKFDENLTKAKNSLRLGLSKFQNINKQNLYNIERILNQIGTSATILDIKHEEAGLKIPELTNRTENYLESISEIITNLQYHDIIRQKMEHVQNAHNQIITELNNLNNISQTEMFSLSEHAQQFLQIRDIASLQIAQLINTNREYQNAIEIITQKFLEVGEDMNAVSALCLQFAGNRFSGQESYFKEVEEKLTSVITLMQILLNTNLDFTNEFKIIKHDIENNSEILNTISEVSKTIEHISNQAIRKTIDKFGYQNDFSDILSQIRELTIRVTKNFNNANRYYQEAIDTCGIKLDKNNSEAIKNTIQYDFSQLSAKISNLLVLLRNHSDKIDRLLGENSLLGMQISTEIRSAIEQVKYYDYFENVIVEIINELNNIVIRLTPDTLDAIKRTKKTNIDFLKEKYTTKSEMLVHENLAENFDILNLDMKVPEDKKNDDEVELF